MVGYRASQAGRASIVVSYYGPISASFPAHIGGGARLLIETEYPFEDIVRIIVNAPAAVDVALRIPGWAGAPTVRVGSAAPQPAIRGAFHTLTCAGGEACAILLDLSPSIVVTPGWGAAGGVSVTRGPLVFALGLFEDWSCDRRYAFQSADWTVTSNSTWNVALAIRSLALGDDGMTLHRAPPRSPAQEQPAFARAHPRVWLTGMARIVPGWTSPDGGATAGSPPPSPVCVSEEELCGELMAIRLVPYGNTRLRITVFPYTLDPAPL